jgi:asparagine synthase (glutamine-hydrolysing)
MCGIAGICHLDGRPIEPATVHAMSQALAHRGPDDEGTFVSNGTPSVGLASRRLAVIDVEGGHQPMSIDDGALTIVYNGELWNAGELRGELEARGRRFRTRCDTEVLLHGYAVWGTDLLEHLNGMWAFAIWDRDRRRLFLARDRLGVKPLVYAPLSNGIAFASEIKALTQAGLVQRRLNPEALPHYLSFFAIPEPHTLIEGVQRLAAGHALLFDAAGLREYQYWDCAVPEEDDRGADVYKDELRELLHDSVRRQLVSDVPLGVLLSGGIDSRLVATLAADHVDRLRTFTLGFGTLEADERDVARTVAEALGSLHRDEVLEGGEAARALPKLLVAYDEPGQSLLQTHFVSRLARRDVTVVLSGLGGDELFSSYPTHVVVNTLARLDEIPGSLRTGLLQLSRLVPGRRSERLRALAAMESDERATRVLLHQTDPLLRRDLLAAEIRTVVDLDAPARHLEQHYERATAAHPLNRLLYVYLKTYLTDELLRAADAMSMLHGLELRPPLLDHRVVEYAMRMPAHHKMSTWQGKRIVRELAAELLPTPLARGKKGFAPPHDSWLRGALEPEVRELLSESSVRSRGVFDPGAVKRLLDEHARGNGRVVQPVMMLYSFEVWARGWLDGTVTELDERRPAVALRERAPDLSVVIVNWNTKARLRSCLESVEKQLSRVACEVIVVDNASADCSAELVSQRFPSVRLIRNSTNVGFGAANNQAMRMARGRWVLLLNSDTVLIDDSVADLFEAVDHERSNGGRWSDLGIAHCRLVFPDGRLQHTAYRFPTLPRALFEALGLYKLTSAKFAAETLLAGYWDHAAERDVDWVAGSFMLLPREVFNATGGFDERYFMYGEDLEWCYRIRDRGWRVRFFPRAAIVHYDHQSANMKWGDERIARCIETQRDVYAGRHGRAATRMLLLTQLGGQALRLLYYGLRRRLPGRRARSYEPMQRNAAISARALAAVALGRR